MASPWSQSNDFRIAIAMKAALEVYVPATCLFKRQQPRAYRIWPGGGRRITDDLSPSFREHFNGQAAGVDRSAVFIRLLRAAAWFRLEILSAVALL